MIIVIDSLDCQSRGDLFYFFSQVQEHVEAHHTMVGFVWPPPPYIAHPLSPTLDLYHAPLDPKPYAQEPAPAAVTIYERTGPPADLVKISTDPEIWTPASQVFQSGTTPPVQVVPPAPSPTPPPAPAPAPLPPPQPAPKPDPGPTPPFPKVVHARAGLAAIAYYHSATDPAPYKSVAVSWPMTVTARTGDMLKVNDTPEIWVRAQDTQP